MTPVFSLFKSLDFYLIFYLVIAFGMAHVGSLPGMPGIPFGMGTMAAIGAPT